MKAAIAVLAATAALGFALPQAVEAQQRGTTVTVTQGQPPLGGETVEQSTPTRTTPPPRKDQKGERR
jgi:hypothetical protein